MSRIFSKLEELPQQRTIEPSQSQTASVTPILKKIQFSFFLILCTIAVLTVVIFLGVLSSNVATIKSNVFLSMDTKIQQQQNQIITLTKKLTAIQSSVDNRINKDEVMTLNLNKDMQTKLADINSSLNNTLDNKFDTLNTSVNSKLGQTSVDLNRMEAVLQANIDELNTKVNKLQLSVPVSPATGDQT